MEELETSSITRAAVWVATEILCVKDGTVLQLWVDQSSPRLEGREWRPLPEFETASKNFNCYRCVLPERVETDAT